MTSRIVAGLSLLAVPALLLSACGGGDGDGASTASTTPVSAPPEPTTLWVADWWDDQVVRIDTATADVSGTVDVYAPTQLSAGPDAVWTEGSRIDPAALEAEQVARSGPEAVAASSDGAWFAYPKDGPRGPSVRRYDDATGELGEPIALDLGDDWTTLQLVASGDVLYGLGWNGQVFRLDTTTGDLVVTEDASLYVTGIDVTADAVWATTLQGVFDLSPDDLSITREFDTPGSASPLALDPATDGGIWVLDDAAEVRRLDTGTGEYGDPVPLPPTKVVVADLEMVDGTAWVLRGNQLVGVDTTTGETVADLQVGKKKSTTYRMVAQ